MSNKSRKPNVNSLFINSEYTTTKTAKKDRHKLTKPSTPIGLNEKSKERYQMENLEHQTTNHYLLKGGSIKQHNVHSGNTSPNNVVQYSASDDSAMVELTIKTSNNRRPRSKSTVSAREPWGQLLKKGKVSEKDSVFNNFDPLRTLHFLFMELQLHIQTLLPEDKNVQEIVTAMQSALKRVPPEVASTIHLQQSIGLLPQFRIAEKPYIDTESRSVQTLAAEEQEEIIKIKKIMEESTIKLEESCRQLEIQCTKLQNEKLCLEAQLQTEKSTNEFLKRRIEDLESLNKDFSEKIYRKEEKITELITNTKAESKSIISDLKQSKSNLEKECVKLKHQLRVSALEKEKYLAILAVRDKQIQEIRNEMIELQEVVNEQLISLHNNAIATMPSTASVGSNNVDNHYQNKENANETISSINTQDLQAPEVHLIEKENIESQRSINNIRDMFSELKEQAFALTGKNF